MRATGLGMACEDQMRTPPLRGELERMVLNEILRTLQRRHGHFRPCLNVRRCGREIDLDKRPTAFFCDGSCWRQFHTIPGQVRRLQARAKRRAA